MIGFAYDLLVDHVLAPQAAAPTPAERRAYLDPDAVALDVEAQEIDVLSTSSAPVAGTQEIGGGVEVRHTISVAVDVQHGDRVEARRLRDLIALDLVLRLLDARGVIEDAVDATTGQYVTRVGWSVDYTPLGTSDTNESATLTFTIDTQLDR